jgi:hypothetical protein
MKERGQGRPEGAPKEEDRAPQKEQGRGQQESAERQPLPNVWDVLERRERLDELKPKRYYIYPDGSIQPPLSNTFYREERELNRLSRELREKGTPRDKLILKLGSHPQLLTRGLSQQEEFQKFRSQVEQMSDEEIAEEIRRKKQFKGATFHSVGLLHVIKEFEKQTAKDK